MIPEVKIVIHVNYIVLIVSVFFGQVLQNLHLDQCLMMEPR